MELILWLAYIFIFLVSSLVLYFKWAHSYWKRMNIDFEPPTFILGSLRPSKESYGQMSLRIYRNMKSKGIKHGGFYMLHIPMWMPVDTKIIRSVILKDFNHFMNHGFYFNDQNDPLSGHLFNLTDNKWKHLRSKMTPAFSSGKMKMMFETMLDCTKDLNDVVKEVAESKEALDIKELLARYTTDIIGNCAFGITCNSIKHPDAEFRKYGKMVFEDMNIIAIINQIVPKSILDFIKWKSTKREVDKFFRRILKETIEFREKNNVYRKDFLHLLIQLKNLGEVTDDERLTNDTEKKSGSLTIDELAAQAYVFYIAGFETSSTTMTFALYELSRNQAIQEKLRQEILSVLKKHNYKITYDAVQEMPYLEQVLNETMRLYPPVTILSRICTQDYKIPDTQKILKTGTLVNVPIWGLHLDEGFYPNPNVFDPDRFTEENFAARPNYTFLPFGEGPRACIGLRFGMLQSKVGLISILKDYKITLNPKTREPLRIDPNSFVLAIEDVVYIDVHKL